MNDIICQVINGIVHCQVPEESFLDLLRSGPHWGIEALVTTIENLFTGVIIGIVWTKHIKPHWDHHKIHDQLHEETLVRDSRV